MSKIRVVAALAVVVGSGAIAAPAVAATPRAAYAGPPTADPFSLTAHFSGGVTVLAWTDLRTQATGTYPGVQNVENPGMSADGTAAVAGDYETGDLLLVGVGTDAVSTLLSGSPAGGSDDTTVTWDGGAFDPAGTAVATVKDTQTTTEGSSVQTRDLYTVPTAGGTPTLVASGGFSPTYTDGGTLLYTPTSGSCALESVTGSAAPTCFLTVAALDSAVGGTAASVTAHVTPGSGLASLEVLDDTTADYPGNEELATLDLATKTVRPLPATTIEAAGPGYAAPVVDPTGTEMLYLYDYPESSRGPATLRSLTLGAGGQRADIDDHEDYFALDAHWPSQDDSAAAAGYAPLPAPVRVLDTRRGIGAPAAPLVGGKTLDVALAGQDGIAADATAVVLNLTGISPTAATYLKVYPTPSSGSASPVVSDLNLAKGQTAANAVTVELGAGGRVRVSSSAGSLGVAADVVGYYAPLDGGSGESTPPGFGTYHALATPQRVMDTRKGTGVRKGALGTRGFVDLKLPTSAVPAGAAAVVVNLGAIAGTAATYVSAYATPATASGDAPSTSTLNLAAGETRANLATVTLGSDASVRFYNYAGATSVFADVVGYYTPGRTGSAFYAVAPSRILDTRIGSKTENGVIGPIAQGASLDGIGRGSITTSGGYNDVPAGATSIQLNVTAIAPTKATYLSVFASPSAASAAPTFSTLNAAAHATVAASAVTAVNAAGEYRVFNYAGATSVAVDLAGFFAPPPA